MALVFRTEISVVAESHCQGSKQSVVLCEEESTQIKSCSHRQLPLHFTVNSTLSSTSFNCLFSLSCTRHFTQTTIWTQHFTHCHLFLKGKKQPLVLPFHYSTCLKVPALLVKIDLLILAQMVGGWTGHHKSPNIQGASFLLPPALAGSLLPGLPPSSLNVLLTFHTQNPVSPQSCCL